MATKMQVAFVPHDSGACADIVGFDFADYDARDIERVRQIWLQFGVIRFKQTTIDDNAHIAFSRHFGEFVIHPKQLQEGAHPVHREILVLSNAMKDGKPSGALGNSEATWHTDTWFYERPPAAAILRAITLPAEGGNTYFLSTYDALETLDPALRQAIEGRQVFFQRVFDKTGRLRLGQVEPKSSDFREWNGMVHPLVRTHGESGRKALYIGGVEEGSWIVGMPLDESTDIIAQIWTHVRKQPRFMQEWEVGDIVMWDNRCTMHRRDSFDASMLRVMHRTTTAGERPI